MANASTAQRVVFDHSLTGLSSTITSAGLSENMAYLRFPPIRFRRTCLEVFWSGDAADEPEEGRYAEHDDGPSVPHESVEQNSCCVCQSKDGRLLLKHASRMVSVCR